MSFSPTRPPAVGRSPDQGFVLGPDDGDAYWWLGSLTINKVTREDTADAFDIVDHRVPAGYAPPLHVHRDQDEVFYVIDGTLVVRCGDRQWQAGSGFLVFLPRHVPHGFTVSGDAPARTLLINAPAGFSAGNSALGAETSPIVLSGSAAPTPAP